VGNGLGGTAKYLRRTTSGAAGYGLGNTIKYLRGAAGIDLGTTIEYLRRAASAAADNGLGAALNYLRGAAGNGRAQRPTTCDAQRTPPRATAWAPRSNNCD
jgi:predicted ABC-type sugar transport system permease subunit